MKPLSTDYRESVDRLSRILRVGESFDLVMRRLRIGEDELSAFYKIE